MALQTLILNEPAALEELAPAWQALLERSGSNVPTMSPAWLLAWWRVFGGLDGRALRVVAFRDGPRLVGLAPFVARRCWYPPGIPLRRVELLGSGEPEQDEICSDYLGLLVEQGAEDGLVTRLVDLVLSGQLGAWDEALLPAMDGTGRLPVLLRDAFARKRLSVRLEMSNVCPYVPLPSSWDEYLARLPSSRRYLVRRSLRDFEKWAGGEAKVERVVSPDDIDRFSRVLMALHAERWSAAGEAGVFQSARFRAFHAEVMPRLHDRGALDLGYLSVRGVPLAAFYNVVWDGRLCFYQSGRSLSTPPNIRLGIVMHALNLQWAIEHGLREYDFLAGASRYKMTLALSTRPLVRLRVARPSLVEAARRSASLAIDQARALRDTLRPPKVPDSTFPGDDTPPPSTVPVSTAAVRVEPGG